MDLSATERTAPRKQTGMAVLVISCDKYADAWPPFFELFFKFWDDCAHNVYLGTNFLGYHDERIEVLKTGEDVSWSDGVRRMVEQIEEPYILTFLEDEFLAKAVDSAAISMALSLAKEEGVACFRLHSSYLPKMSRTRAFSTASNVFWLLPQDEFCVNTGIAIWERETLLGLLTLGYSAWDFEVKNSSRFNAIGELPGKFLTVEKSPFSIRHGIVRGRWLPPAVRFCRRQGIILNIEQRSVVGKRELAWLYCKQAARRALPAVLRRRLKKALIALGGGRGFASPY